MNKKYIVIEEGTGDYYIVDDLKTLIEEMYEKYTDETVESFNNIHSVIMIEGEIRNIENINRECEF
jgi:hypothetical protein